MAATTPKQDNIDKLLSKIDKLIESLDPNKKSLIDEFTKAIDKSKMAENIEKFTKTKKKDEGKEKRDKEKRGKEKQDKETDRKYNRILKRFGFQANTENGKTRISYQKADNVREFGQALNQVGQSMTGRFGKVGKQISNFGSSLSKLSRGMGAFIAFLEIGSQVLKSVSEADARQQSIQNRRNTNLTNRNIKLSRTETEGNVDTLNVYKENALSKYNKIFTELQGKTAIENAKAIASTNTRINSIIGDVNDAAWSALASKTDIDAQNKKLGLQVAKTNAIENRAISQRNYELGARQSERNYEMKQAVLEAQKTDADLTLEDMKNAREHPWSETLNRIAGGRTSADNVKGDTKWNSKEGFNADKFLSQGVAGSTLGGAIGHAVGVAGLSFGNNLVEAGSNLIETRTKKKITDATNALNAAQASNENQIKMQTTVLSNSNEIRNKVLEGMTEIKNSVIDTETEIKKAYQKMAQEVEKWHIAFQDKAYDSGIGKGMTKKGQLNKYRSFMTESLVDLASKYGINADQLFAMQNGYTAEGRSKLLNRKDLEKQASFSNIYMGGDFNTTAEIANGTEIFNMGVSDTVNHMEEMAKQVNKMGLDGRKYMKDMVKYLKTAQKYDFKNGLKGMMNIAKWAQNVRFNMDSVPSMIDDIQKGGLEGIITKAAKLQVMGGRFAMGADPIAMAYEAYNDPAALMKRYNDMTKGMGTFNSKTGEVTFNGMEQDQMRLLAEYSGQSLEDIRKQATYNVKKSKVEGTIKDKDLTEDQRMSLINKAFYQDGQWKVNDVTGNAINLSDVNSQNIGNVQADTYEGKMEQGMQEIVSFTKLFSGNTESNMAAISNAINQSGAADKELEERLKEAKNDFGDKFDKYSAQVLTNMQEATLAYKDFLNNFKDPKDQMAMAVTTLKTFQKDTFDQLNKILTQMGGDGKKIADMNELKEKLAGLTFGIATKGKDGKIINKNISAEELIMNGSLYKGNNGNLYANQERIRELYGVSGKISYGQYTKQQLADRGFSNKTITYTDVGGETNYEKAVKVEAARAAAKKKNAIEKKKRQNGDVAAVVKAQKNGTATDEEVKGAMLLNMEKFSDSIVASNNKQILTSAANITPINDGNVQFAKSDPKDTAIFAKTGGPFDTLFNEVFGRINDVYNSLQSGSKLQVEPLKVTIDGRLELNGGGQTVDLIKQIQNDPLLARMISDILVQNISSKYYGGRPTGGATFRN